MTTRRSVLRALVGLALAPVLPNPAPRAVSIADPDQLEYPPISFDYDAREFTVSVDANGMTCGELYALLKREWAKGE